MEQPANAAGAPAASEAEVYTLRVWRHGAQFRAVLRAVGDERLHLFHEPQRLGEFLAVAPTPHHPDPP